MLFANLLSLHLVTIMQCINTSRKIPVNLPENEIRGLLLERKFVLLNRIWLRDQIINLPKFPLYGILHGKSYNTF